jgi:hypothetical protein
LEQRLLSPVAGSISSQTTVLFEGGSACEPGKSGIPIEPYYAASEENFPNKSKLKIYSGDDVVVIGYPRHFFDEYNKLPILKSGILITPLAVHYDTGGAAARRRLRVTRYATVKPDE